MKEWITGRNPVFEVLRAKRRHAFRLFALRGMRMEGHLPEIVEMAKARKLPIHEVQRFELDKIERNNQGIAIEVSEYPYRPLDDLIKHSQSTGEASFFLLLDTIQDPQNLGTLLRTAEIMGVHGVIIPSAKSALITPSVVASSSGASEHLLVSQFNLAQAIDRLKGLDIWVYGLDEDERSRTPAQLNLKGGIAIVVGNEGTGLRSLVRKKCDEIMRIPQYGKIDSLNAAVAGSIAIYLARQARG
jgi:23S rRNA (guanosine2251-2'-O)-methyltransferase